jgi:hypothetical protein
MREHDFSEFDSDQLPQKEDVLFPRRSSEEQQANLIQTLGWDWVYSNGFRLAARHLAKEAGTTRTDQEFLFYPIVYLYRHYTELALKAIIKSALGLLDREFTTDHLKTLGNHGLLELWHAAKPLLNPVCELAGEPSFLEADLEGVDSYIRQIHEHDPDGQRFRYATTKPKKAKGAAESDSAAALSLSSDLKSDDVRALTIYMERLSYFFENIAGWLEVLEEAKAEIGRNNNLY